MAKRLVSISICMLLFITVQGQPSANTIQGKIGCNDTVFLNQLSKFIEDESQTIYRFKDYKLSFIEETNSFIVHYLNEEIGDICYDKYYEGPGFQIYKIDNSTKKYFVIIVEALADFGTSWYYATLWYDNVLISSLLIDDPRANSETTELSDFMNITVSGDMWTIRLKRSKIAPYSFIPEKYFSDEKYVYIQTLLNNNNEK